MISVRPILKAKSKGVMSVRPIIGVNFKAKNTGVISVRPITEVNLKAKRKV